MTWNKLSEKKPINTGCYLCITNDNKYVVCHVAANGWWSKIPDAEFYGDMGRQVILGSKKVEREVIYWMELPLPPNKYTMLSK